MIRIAMRHLLLTFLLFVGISVAAQSKIDSLRRIVNNPKLHDTTRLYHIALIIDELYEDKASVYYTNLMGQIALKNLKKAGLSDELRNKYRMYLASYYNNISVQLEERGDLRSLPYLQRSLDLYRAAGVEEEYYSTLVSKGLLLYRRNRDREAIACYFEALKYFEKNKKANADGISYVYSNLGVLYGEQYVYTEAIRCLKKAIDYLNAKEESPTLEDELQKAGMYYNLGAAYISVKDYAKAKQSLIQALEYARKTKQQSYQCYALCKLSEIDSHFNRLDLAEATLLQAKDLAQNNLSNSGVMVTLGELYLRKGQHAKAQHYLDKGLEASTRIRNSNLQKRAYDALYKINKIKGNYQVALAMLEGFQKINDSVRIFKNRNELKVQNLHYEYEKKELQHKLETQRKNYLLYGLLGLILLLSAIIWVVYKNYRQKHAIAQLEKNDLRQKLLRSQMNPHFIFNSIDNIQSLIYNKQTDEAVHYLTKFSRLTREILEYSNRSTISLSEERSMIENYLVIQQLLYNNKFSFILQVDETRDPELVFIPPMLTQPFIENAIKHGLKNKETGGQLSIRFYWVESNLFFEVTDNGEGFDQQKAVNRKSLALQITRERLASEGGNERFKVHVKNITDQDKGVIGAKVCLELPYIYEN